MKKTQIIGIVVLVLIFGVVLGWTLLQKGKTERKEEITPKREEKVEEVFSLSGTVSAVNVESSFLMVMPTEGKNEVKVIVSKDTKIFKIIYSGKGNPEFVTERVEITLKDVKVGDRVFIKTRANIAGKKVIDDVEYIEVI
jgi:hypothetical protein